MAHYLFPTNPTSSLLKLLSSPYVKATEFSIDRPTITILSSKFRPKKVKKEMRREEGPLWKP
ncbi:hypothetical protein CCACVL1_05875 [Corchorus capsularis]|uniref:Uncharacterized protein n=1 Tax=Corchorus capsularis TaxID=210143 RepID=A0A1R3JIQ8_COCAP|nr:hypothetical protein CCACVL1_05875 [Corchorus capsularis]